MLSPSAPPAGREKGGRPACPVGGRRALLLRGQVEQWRGAAAGLRACGSRPSPHQVCERYAEGAGDEQQVHVLNAAADLDALDCGTPHLHALGERLLREVRMLAGLADPVPLLLTGEADPLGLVVGHPSKLKP